jgi:hypothetical protein
MRSNWRSAVVKGAARSPSAICWLRSFSSALANAAALAAPACCLRAVLSFSTTETQSIVAAARRLRSARFLFTLSIALAHALWAAGCPFRRSTFVVLRGMTTGKFVMGIPTRLSSSRCAVWAQAEHRRVWRSIPHSATLLARADEVIE